LSNKVQEDVPEIAREILEKVITRIDESYKKYGDQYLLADIPHETDEELLDLVGWPMLHAIRMQVYLRKFKTLNGEYLKKFIARAETTYLQMLDTYIVEELTKRSLK